MTTSTTTTEAQPGALPDDMPDDVQAQLRLDRLVFGTSFYEDTANGYQRRDPTTVVQSVDAEASDD